MLLAAFRNVRCTGSPSLGVVFFPLRKNERNSLSSWLLRMVRSWGSHLIVNCYFFKNWSRWSGFVWRWLQRDCGHGHLANCRSQRVDSSSGRGHEGSATSWRYLLRFLWVSFISAFHHLHHWVDELHAYPRRLHSQGQLALYSPLWHPTDYVLCHLKHCSFRYLSSVTKCAYLDLWEWTFPIIQCGFLETFSLASTIAYLIWARSVLASRR